MAVGELTGELRDTAGNLIRNVNRTVLLPVSNLFVNGTCTILTLDLGPLDLNLLGLEVHLYEGHLEIIADPAGGLLGQLLCAIANLLDDSPLPLLDLAALLSQLLGLLG